MKDIKYLLKEARETIKNKDYDLCLKISKMILKEDKSNYMALVFLGLALQEVGPFEQAPKAFQKAIDLNPTNSLAWNGLVSYYEKLETDESKNKLVDLYISTLEVETNCKKILEYSDKLCLLYEKGDIKKVVTTIYNCTGKAENSAVHIFETLAKLYEKLKQVPSELQPIFEECLCKLLGLKDYLKVEYFSSYLNLLYQQKKYSEVFQNAEKMQDAFENDVISLTWMCKIYNQAFVEGSELANSFSEKIKDYLPKLLNLQPNDIMALFTKSIQKLLDNELTETQNLLKKVCNLRPGLVHAWVLLTKVYLKLHQYDNALQSFLTASKLLSSDKYVNLILTGLLDYVKLEILSKSSREKEWNEAVNIFNKIEDANVRKLNMEHLIVAYINLRKFNEAKLLLTDIKNIDYSKFIILESKLLEKQNKFKEALKLLEEDPQENSDWLIQTGLMYWNLEEFKNALVPFLKAAKFDSNNYLCFFYLGNYYQKIEDFAKARRCYEKSFNLNPSSQKIAVELSKIYCKLKNWDAAKGLLLDLTKGPINDKNSWAWFHLGLTYLQEEDYSKAIEKLQFLVRIEKENTYYWQSLADAYFARGSLTSALKCYEKSLEFTDNTLYPSLQKANIKKTLGLYDEAKNDFTDILFQNKCYLPALKGLAETSMCQAKECFRDQRLGTARDHAQCALKNLTVAITEKSNFSCIWKLVADVCLFVTRLPEKYCCLFVTDTLVAGKTMIEREDMFTLATSCYCKAISLTKDNILIWHDLANCYLKNALQTEDIEKQDVLFSYATAAAKYCTLSNSKNWQHWNLLGNIEMLQKPPNFALAQHYFIKAITVENNNPISWSNLGILYLNMGDMKLANKAFAQGQRSDPNYVHNWIGQALIAESMGVEEAMDLFRHSVQLDHHQQGALGYGHWVCQTLLEAPQKTISYSIESMHAIPVACDALTWYIEKDEDHGAAWNMLGILKERMQLNKGSLEAFKNAYKLAENHRDPARINYGRLLYKQSQYIPAANLFQEVQEATFSSGSGLALALFKSQNYEDSYAAYEQALHWLTEEQSHQSELLVALASMAYMFQGLEGAKTLLFQSIQLKPPSPWGLYATLALGLMHKDLELGDLVLKELEPLKDNPECLPHYAILLCTKLLREEKPDKAVKELSKLVHRYPDSASVWLTLSVTMLRVKSERKRALAAVNCAKASLKIGQAKMDITKILGYIAFGQLLAGDLKKVLISAQKAIFCYPNLADGWALLLAVLVIEKTRPRDFLSNIFDYVNSLDSTELLSNWLKKLRSKFN